MEDMTRNIEPEICMVNGRVLVKISNDQEVYTYGKDNLIDGNGQEQKAFCMKKDDTEKEITFVLKNGETIKERDNGVMLLVAIADKKITIQTGYGMEGVLPDAICKRVS